MSIADLGPGHVPGLVDLFAGLPPSDLTFVKEDVTPDAVAGWLDQPGRRWVSVSGDGAVTGFAALVLLPGWSDHVAELRLVTDPAVRGQGLGRRLALHALTSAVRDGLVKVVVELPATQERTIDMFLALGFTGEALLRDHFRDRSGQLQDLVMLAYFAEQNFDAMSVVGLADALEGS